MPVNNLNNRQRLEAAAMRQAEIRNRLDALGRYDKLTPTQGAERFNLSNEYGDLEEIIEDLGRQRAADLTEIRSLANGENGGSTIPTVDPSRNDDDQAAWAAGSSHRDQPTQQRDLTRRRLDDLRSVPDEGRERLTRTFERAEGSQDGDQELTALSRWLLATSAPAYARAVGKLFRDPQNGHREFDREELAAYQASKQAQRAMSIGTDSAGGFLLPTHLDPQILLSNAGAVDPIRQLARVETIATDTWNGVSSAGVTASWDAEATEVSDDSPTLA